MAATVAITQNDIKKVLAYSTVSQLGYMFLAAGVGAYFVAIFHVMTHAFFKACLFLGSGSVIHAMHDVEHKLEDKGLVAGTTEPRRRPRARQRGPPRRRPQARLRDAARTRAASTPRTCARWAGCARTCP